MMIHSLRLAPLTIFPNESFRHASFSDIAEGGKSSIDEFSSTGNSIIMKYTLSKGYKTPYTGLQITSGEFLDLEKFDSVKIKISSKKSEKLRFILISFIKNFSISSKPLSSMYLIKEIPVTKEIKSFDISLSEFRVEKWWYEVNELNPFDKSIKPDFESISAVNIENAECFGFNIQDEVKIDEITFYKSGKRKWFIFAVLTMLYLILTYIFRKNIFSSKQETLFYDYKKIEFKNNISTDHETILRIISENYTDPELSVEKTAELSNTDTLKISKIIKKNTGLSFPQYLNAIRITEAKRLLAETDVKIIEISFAVGFGNLSHFNRCFKTSEKISPKDYRKKYRKN
ncbi:MAG TPA: AraC family transcriptional regulator [Spirochaetota bacterium]|nr:AraC family transcriptional regulator [Spirochaetota bacterium]